MYSFVYLACLFPEHTLQCIPLPLWIQRVKNKMILQIALSCINRDYLWIVKTSSKIGNEIAFHEFCNSICLIILKPVYLTSGENGFVLT